MVFIKSKNKPVAADAHRHHVLVVDRDTSVYDQVAGTPAAATIEFDFCDTLGELFERSLDSYDLVIIDLSVLDRKWASVIASIKQRHDAEGVGLIATSASMSPDDIITALNAGADDYLLKPYQATELIARSQAVIRRLH